MFPGLKIEKQPQGVCPLHLALVLKFLNRPLEAAGVQTAPPGAMKVRRSPEAIPAEVIVADPAFKHAAAAWTQGGRAPGKLIPAGGAEPIFHHPGGIHGRIAPVPDGGLFEGRRQ